MKSFLSQVSAFLNIPIKNVKRIGYFSKEKLNVYERTLLNALIEYKNKYKKDPTQEELAVICNMGLSSVRKASSGIEEKGCISRERHKIKGYLTEYHYTILKTAKRHDWEVTREATGEEILPDKKVPCLQRNALILNNNLCNNHHKRKNEIKSEIDEKPVAAQEGRSGFKKETEHQVKKLIQDLVPDKKKRYHAFIGVSKLFKAGLDLLAISTLAFHVNAHGMVPNGRLKGGPPKHLFSYIASDLDSVRKRKAKMDMDARAKEEELAKFKLAQEKSIEELKEKDDPNDPIIERVPKGYFAEQMKGLRENGAEESSRTQWRPRCEPPPKRFRS